MIESFIGALLAILLVEAGYIAKDYFEYRMDIYQHKKYCRENNLPYIKPSDANKALENFMNKPIEEFVDALIEDDTKNNFRICPKCLEYKRNFMIEGKNRECMDCAIGSIGD